MEQLGNHQSSVVLLGFEPSAVAVRDHSNIVPVCAVAFCCVMSPPHETGPFHILVVIRPQTRYDLAHSLESSRCFPPISTLLERINHADGRQTLFEKHTENRMPAAKRDYHQNSNLLWDVTRVQITKRSACMCLIYDASVCCCTMRTQQRSTYIALKYISS